MLQFQLQLHQHIDTASDHNYFRVPDESANCTGTELHCSRPNTTQQLGDFSLHLYSALEPSVSLVISGCGSVSTTAVAVISLWRVA